MSPEIAAKLAGRRVVASISGGKDSAALSLWLTEQGIEHDRIFLDTGWEHDATYEYLRGELTRAIGPITWLRAERQMEEMITKRGMFPTRLKRFCTQELKVRPAQKYLNDLIDAGHELVNAVGIRRAESRARSQMEEWEWSDGFDCEVWRPLIHWTEAEVILAHQRHGLRPNPLYLLGAKRVGCWPCIFAAKPEIRFMAEVDPARVDRIRALETTVTARRSERRAAKGQVELGPASWFNEKHPDAAGNYLPVPIDQAVAWSKTSRGGKQFQLFDDRDPNDGCMRWGMCETEPDAPEKLQTEASGDKTNPT